MAASDYFTDLSLILSRVTDDIGVNEECILRRRKSYLLKEHCYNLESEIVKKGFKVFMFGSQSEGTTTPGLHSDYDLLWSSLDYNIIQDATDLALGKGNMLMIETEYPGYCKLQVFRFGGHVLKYDEIIDGNTLYDEQSRYFLNNERNVLRILEVPNQKNGPAFRISGQVNNSELDSVTAFQCTTWPNQCRRMSLCQRPRDWPTPEMIRYIETSGCFIVPTGHRLSDKPKEEWRISTSLAERCLMFSLNITHIRCYVLLKMIVKTFIEPNVPDVISSYICKTLLFHCIERSNIDFWKEWNLLNCVSHVLLYMLAALRSMNCPNYFNKSANLLLGKIDGVKQKKLLHIIRHILNSKGGFLLQIQFDNINCRLTQYISVRCSLLNRDDNEIVRNNTFTFCLLNLLVLVINNTSIFKYTRMALDRNVLLQIRINYAMKGRLQSEVSAIMFPFLCSYLASLEANESILRGTELTATTLLLFKRSLNSDTTSSRLKYASYLYCTGQWQRTLTVLEDVETRLSGSVIPVCVCVNTRKTNVITNTHAKRERCRSFSTRNIALCVTFRQMEIQCCPLEIRFEMFRSTEEDKTNVGNITYNWLMEMSAIDPLPYIFFLQFMVYRRLRQPILKNESLLKLVRCAMTCSVLSHRETAFNILGQCMEHELMCNTALWCYVLSLKERQSNNAAKWHISRLLSSLINDKQAGGCHLQ